MPATDFLFQWLENRNRYNYLKAQEEMENKRQSAENLFKIGLEYGNPKYPKSMRDKGVMMMTKSFEMMNPGVDVAPFMQELSNLTTDSSQYSDFYKRLSFGAKQVSSGKLSKEQFLNEVVPSAADGVLNSPEDLKNVEAASKFFAGNMPDMLEQQWRKKYQGDAPVSVGNDFFANPYKPGQFIKAPKGQTININTADKAITELNKGLAKSVVVQQDDARGAAKALESLYEGKKLLESGMITGTGAEFLASVGNLLSSRLGFKAAEDPVANTQAYAAVMGTQVGQIIKQFGSGTGLSDADREYAEKIAGGKITLNEKALKRILSINEKAYKNVINNYNAKAEKITGRPGAADNLLYDLKVKMPEMPAGDTTATEPNTITVKNPDTGEMETWDLNSQKRIK